MTTYDTIKGHLEKRPLARERKKKNQFLAVLLLQKYKGEIQTGLDVGTLERMIVDAGTYDRAWRQVLQHEPHLRGTDYNEKQVLEEEKELELGYQPGIKATIKKVGEITKPYDDK